MEAVILRENRRVLSKVLRALLADTDDDSSTPEVAESGIAFACLLVGVCFAMPGHLSEKALAYTSFGLFPEWIWTLTFIGFGTIRALALVERLQNVREFCCWVGFILFGVVSWFFFRSGGGPIGGVLFTAFAFTEGLLFLRLRGAK